MANTPFCLHGMVELDAIRNSEDGPGPYNVLETVRTTNGGEYIYLRMNATQTALPKGRFVLYKPNGSISVSTSASAPEGWPLALSKNAMTAGQYGWFCIKGKELLVTGSSGLEVLKSMYIGQQYAQLSTATVSAVGVVGVAINADVAPNTTANCILNYPRIMQRNALA